MMGTLLKRKKAVPDGQPRCIKVNEGFKDEEFLGNYVSTTKYNLLTFLPKALFEQYRYIL